MEGTDEGTLPSGVPFGTPDDAPSAETTNARQPVGAASGREARVSSAWRTRASEVESRTMPYETYLNLIAQVDDLVDRFEHHPDATTREQALALLEGVDALHREGLTRLVEALREAGAGDLVARAAEDPVVEILLGLYDLVELDLPEEQGSSSFVPVDRVAVSPHARRDADGASSDD